MSIARTLWSVLPLTCAVSALAFAAETPWTKKPAAANTAPSDAADRSLLIIHNPDGTFTVQKQPRAEKSGDTKQKGLVIPPQVIVPIVPTARLPEKDPSNPAH
jgi:hypothetical protein